MSASFCLPSTHVAPQVPLWKALIILAWAREKERCDFFCVSSRKKISKNKYFCEHGAATRKIWAHWGRNKDDGFASWREQHASVCVCACVFERRRVLAATVSALFSFVCMSFLNCTSRIVLSVCNCAPLFAMSLLYVCVCKKRQKDCLLKRATKAAGTVRLQGTTWDCRQRDW